MWNENYHWNYDYVRLAWDSGFTFENQKSNITLEKSTIGTVDVEHLIQTKDIGLIERFIPFITQFKLDGEQTQILDQNFIKLFRVSQLAVDYLNFCKKYLDNTVVLLKKELAKTLEEKNDLKMCCDDLKNHVLHLKKKMKEPDNTITFKCEDCNKIFSTEEFLLAHIKRRHENQAYQVETDKLQLEIKELKERLNSTEKYTHVEKSEVNNKEHHNVENNSKINDLQQKFEILKTHVESELKLLQTQKNFQEKYEKWFEMAFNNLKLPLNNESSNTVAQEIQYNKQEPIKVIENCDIGIQTAQLNTVVSHVYPTQNNSPASRKQSIDLTDIQEKLSAQTLNHMNKFEEVLEQKISGSMEKIENQMHTFWNKLNEIEQTKTSPVAKPRKKQLINSPKIKTIEPVENSFVKEIKSPVKINYKQNEQISLKSVVKKPSISKSLEKQVNVTKNPKIVVKKSIPKKKQDTSEESITSESEKDEETVSEYKPALTTSPSVTSTKQRITGGKTNEELLDDVEHVLNKRLTELGISANWSGLPKRSYEQAMQVIKHQANLTKRNYPEFFIIRDQIIKQLEKQLKMKQKKSKESHKKHQKVYNFSGNIKMVNKVPILDSKSEIVKQERPRMVAKSKTMYETDSESDKEIPKKSKTIDNFATVIQELKTIQAENSPQQDDVNKNETKSVLKSYPSLGSLSRKKVLFDLESNSKNDEEKHVITKANDNESTSIASSVLDYSKPNVIVVNKDEKSKNAKEDSDWDISDLLT